jgi:hypothetical protein
LASLTARGSSIFTRRAGFRPARFQGLIVTCWQNGAGIADFTLHGLGVELGERGLKVDYRSV